jgi:hypothetical protein
LNLIKATTSVVIISIVFFCPAYAEKNSLQGMKLGFGVDRGLGITGSIGQFNGFIGNDGVAVDYLFMQEKLESDYPLHWYIGGGGYIDWDGDFGARVPIGAEFAFAENVDAYAQVIPDLRFNHDAKFGLGIGLGVRYRF